MKAFSVFQIFRKEIDFMTIWEQAVTILEDLFGAGLAVLDAVAGAIATNVFFQLLFAGVVFGLGYLVISKIVTLIKKIAAGK